MTRVHVAAVLAVFLLFAAIALLVFSLWHKGTAEPREEPAAAEVIEKFVQPTTTFPTPPTTANVARARTGPIVRTASVRPTGEIADIIRSAFARFGPDVAEQAVRVAQCESHLDPRATNGQHASLFQISRTYHEARARRLGFDWSRMWEPAVNAAVAADIYASSGWTPWTCRRAA